MTATNRKTKIFVGALILTLVAAAVVAKRAFYPSVKDSYFAMDYRSLQRVPGGLVVVRPTHFANLPRGGIIYASSSRAGGDNFRMVGCRVPLRDVIAAAYGVSAGRVVLPADAPQGDFDFLVTAGDPRPRLVKVVRKELGYVAQRKTRDTDVLALKVADANLPSLAVSGAGEKENINSQGAKLVFTHVPMAEVAQGLEQFVKLPVVDKTGRTNFYNFSVGWDFKTQHDLQNDPTARATADKILQSLGLRLQPDTASLEMLVVERAG